MKCAEYICKDDYIVNELHFGDEKIEERVILICMCMQCHWFMYDETKLGPPLGGSG
jgi:hypothetical protein